MRRRCGFLLSVARRWRKGKKNAVTWAKRGRNLAFVYKIVAADEWARAQETGVFEGSTVDRADGFIHFSTAAQVAETAARHFSGQDDLLLVAVEQKDFGDKLVYEISRGGALFPHLYAPLPIALAKAAFPLKRRADGAHDFAGLLE
jgi:uncharacterized protein (DUF952 family)